MASHCKLCKEQLPTDDPGIETCEAWCNTTARVMGDMLPEDVAVEMHYYKQLCDLLAALQGGAT